MPPPPQPPPDPNQIAYGVFCGAIDQNSVYRILQSLTMATIPNHNIREAHILFQSTGGSVADGICLYNFLRAMTVDVTLYNVGSVQSIAAIAYLGAKKRKTSARATFMLHRTTVGAQFATAGGLKAITDSILLDDARTESILRDHVTMTDDQWAVLKYHDLFFSGEEAVQMGFAHEVGEFSPPSGRQIFFV